MRSTEAQQPNPWRDLALAATLITLLVTMAFQAERARATAATSATATPAPPTLASCTQDGTVARDACAREALAAQLAAASSVPEGLQAINGQARRDPWLARRCHMLLHELGRLHGGKLRPGEVRHDGKDCAAGFLHGWLLANLDSVDRDAVDAWCGTSPTPLEHADCEHGMGHVLVRRLEGRLPLALVRCRSLGDAAFVRNCASGAFMENRFGGQARDDAAATGHWLEGEPWRPCRRTPDDLLDVCAAWAVRDVPRGRRLHWCAARAAAADPTACRTAVGGIAPITHGGVRTCGTVPACWFGRGFAWAMLGWGEPDVPDAAARCLEARSQPARDACAEGTGFRRAASLDDALGDAAVAACDELFTGAARAACQRGAARRDEPIAYA